MRFARESERLNPRRTLPELRRRRDWRHQRPETNQRVGYEDILARVAEGISHLRHISRTLREATYADSEWDERFRRRWVALVRDAGSCIKDPDADVDPIHDRIDRLAQEFAAEQSGPGQLWPVYGSLLTSMRHIAVVVDDVASARAARDPAHANPSAPG